MFKYYIIETCIICIFTVILFYWYTYLNSFQDKQTTDDIPHPPLGPIVGSTVGVSSVVLVALVIGIVVWKKRVSQPGRLYMYEELTCLTFST